MPTPIQYANANRDRFLKSLLDLARIPSVSTDPAFAEDVGRAAEFLAEELTRAGLHRVEIAPTAGHPVVYGEWLGAGESAPTVLFYAHYDVQPAVKEDGWDTEPFEPTAKGGKIYARGIGDDKLHSVMIVNMAEALIRSEEGSPINLKLVIEGEEEMGSRNFAPWVKANRERLKADYCLICDGGLQNKDLPTVSYGLRGLLACEFTVRGPKSDLHSGTHGGRVHNPAQVVAEMVARLHEESGRVAVPGFYDDVHDLSDTERSELNKHVMTPEDFEQGVGAPQPWGEQEYSLVERATARPTLEINGIFGGYAGDGMKTVIPARASAKITCRLVYDQVPERIYEQVKKFLHEIKPPTVHLDVEQYGRADPVVVSTDSPLVKLLVRAYRHHWSTPPLFRRMGGTVPIASIFHKELALPLLVIGFNVEDGGFHGPNEFIFEDLFHKGLDTMLHLVSDLGSLKETD